MDDTQDVVAALLAHPALYSKNYNSVKGRPLKFSPAQVRAFRQLRAEGYTQKALAEAAGCSLATMNRICTGRIYSDVA